MIKYVHLTYTLAFINWGVVSMSIGSFFLIFGLGGLLFPSHLSANLTLNDILVMAAKKNDELAIIDGNFKAGIEEIKQYRSSLFPMITSNVSGIWNKQSAASASMPLPPTFDEDHIDGTVSSIEIKLMQPLFRFGRLWTVYELAKLQEKGLKLTKQMQREVYFFKVLQAYTQAILHINYFKVAERSVKQAKLLLSFTELEYKKGARNKIDYLRSKSFYEMGRAEERQSSMKVIASVNRLKALLGKSLNDRLQLAIEPEENSSFLKVPLNQIKKKLALQLKEMEVKLKGKQVDYDRGAFYPALDLFGSVSSSIAEFDVDGMPEKDHEDIFKDSNFNYSIGVSLSWTIFDGFRTPSTYRKTKTKLAIAQLELAKEQREQLITLDEAKNQQSVSEQMYQAANLSKEAVQLAYNQINTDYKGGYATLTQLIEVEKELKEAEKRVFEAYSARLMAAANLRMEAGLPIYEEGK